MGKWIGIGIAIVAIITIAFIVCAYLFPDFRVATRDIAIVLLAIFQMIGALLTIALLVALLWAVNAVRSLASDTVLPKVSELTDKLDQVVEKTKSITDNVKTTTGSVSTTTVYVAEQVVAPVIRVSSVFAGVRAGAAFLARRGAPRDSDRRVK